jgi:inorganic pyrophosphatase
MWRKLKPYEKDNGERILNVIVETAKGNRNKFKFDSKHKCFSLGKILPAGIVFPFDFGFVPATVAEDGDPLDVLLLMDAPAFTGCLVPSRLVGVIEAEQQKEGEQAIRNDRLIAVAQATNDYAEIRQLADLNQNLLDEYEHFFKSYHSFNGTRFRVLRVGSAAEAWKQVKKALKGCVKT